MSIDTPWTSTPDRTATLHRPRPGWLTYETFYGLKEKPFSLSSDPSFFYNSSSHATAFDDLLAGIRRRESLSVLSGDIGIGKTTLCRTVLKNLDRQTFSAFVPDPFATREDLLKVVLVDFGVVSAEDLASGRLRGASRTELSYLLYEFLATLSPLQAFAVVFIDEAQNLSLPLLEEIRILSDSDGRERQLQVVLVGQLELREKLRLQEMRQVDQRVSVRCSLEPLDRDGVAGYVGHRLHIAGGTPDRVRFAHETIDAIHEATGGVPRLINRLCDRALHHGHLQRAAVIDPAMFALACAEAEKGQHEPAPPASKSAAPRVKPRATAPDVAPVDGTEAWLAEIDARVNQAVETDAVELPGIDTAPFTPVPASFRRRTIVPLTHMEMLQRIWLRRLKIAVLLLVILAGAGFGLTVAVSILTQPVTSPDVLSPLPPALPTAFVIPAAPADDAAAPAAQEEPIPY